MASKVRFGVAIVAFLCTACGSAAAVPPTGGAARSVMALADPTSANSSPPTATPDPADVRADPCSALDLPARPLTDADTLTDLTACGADGPIPWLDGEREAAQVALRLPGTDHSVPSGPPVTCSTPPLAGIVFVAMSIDEVFPVQEPQDNSPCGIMRPEILKIEFALADRSGG